MSAPRGDRIVPESSSGGIVDPHGSVHGALGYVVEPTDPLPLVAAHRADSSIANARE
jgi:hypothetical protein